MTDAAIIEKIRKLFALGQSPNEHEAASAVSKAQELMQQYDLEMEEITASIKTDRKSTVTSQDGHLVVRDGKPDGWKESLFDAVISASDCIVFWASSNKTPIPDDRVSPAGTVIGVKGRPYVYGDQGSCWYYQKGKFARVIGRRTDIEMALYSYGYIVAELERLVHAYGLEIWDTIHDMADERGIKMQEAERLFVAETGRHPLRAKFSWLKGATASVVENLRNAKTTRQEANEKSTALVVSKSADIQEFLTIERYGSVKAYEEQLARWQADREAERDREAAIPVKQESEKDRLKREKRARVEYENWERRTRKAAQDEWNRLDKDAFQRGIQDGAEVTVKPGLRDGEKIREIA